MPKLTNERIEKIVKYSYKPRLVVGDQIEMPDFSSKNGIDKYYCGCQSVKHRGFSMWTLCRDHEVQLKNYLKDATRYEKVKMEMEVISIKVANIVNDIRYCFSCIAINIR